MRLVTFKIDNELCIGAAMDNIVINLNKAYQSFLDQKGALRSEQIANALLPNNMVEFLEGGEVSLEAAREAIQFALDHQQEVGNLIFKTSEVTLQAPVTKPGKIICVGLNYREHILEMGRELPEFPVIFAKFSNAVIGPQDEIPLSPVTEQLDYEAEFSFVIGKRAKNITKEHALEYVAGYTIVNDITARDLQRRTVQWLQGKTLDGSAPMGPWLVTTDEIPNPSDLGISLTVNGELRQKSNTKNLVFDVSFLVEFLSHIMTLEPGDVICTGTPGGVGFAREPQVFLQDGDIVHIEVEHIGALENRVKKV